MEHQNDTVNVRVINPCPDKDTYDGGTFSIIYLDPRCAGLPSVDHGEIGRQVAFGVGISLHLSAVDKTYYKNFYFPTSFPTTKHLIA